MYDKAVENSIMMNELPEHRIEGGQINETPGNLFDYENDYALAHCISADFALGAGIAKYFQARYGTRDELRQTCFSHVWNGHGYCLVTNNAGQEATFNYEDFVDRNPTFKVYGVLTPGCESKLVPYNYMTGGVSNIYNYMYGLSGAKLPICPWVNDVYLNWLTQNGVNLAVQAASSIGSIIGGAGLLASGVGANKGALMVTGGFASVAQELGSIYSHSLAPKQANGNVNSGDITWATGNSEFTYYEMHIKEEFARRIDKFWSMYGYKVDKLKVPNLTGRRNWNYVKTIDCNIEGYIPQEDLAEIKGMFNNGVTIWHNPSTFLDYSQNNDII